MRLSKNFTLEELMATSHGKLQDMPTGEVILNLTFLCARVLQPLRDAIGRPVYINSGYRSKRLNARVGGVPALIPTFLDYKFNASLIITTLMLNYATNYITDYFVAYPIKDTAGDGLAFQSPQIDAAMRFFRFSKKNAMNIGVFVAIAAVVLIYFILKKTRFGYESKITGLNRKFASYGGIKSAKMMFTTMGLSGAICGFAACIEIFGARYRYVNAMFTTTGYAWTGLMAMLIAKYNPLLTLVYSIFLAGLSIGGQALQRAVGLPMQISDIIQCCITLFVSVKIVLDFTVFSKGGKA